MSSSFDIAAERREQLVRLHRSWNSSDDYFGYSSSGLDHAVATGATEIRGKQVATELPYAERKVNRNAIKIARRTVWHLLDADAIADHQVRAAELDAAHNVMAARTVWAETVISHLADLEVSARDPVDVILDWCDMAA